MDAETKKAFLDFFKKMNKFLDHCEKHCDKVDEFIKAVRKEEGGEEK